MVSFTVFTTAPHRRASTETLKILESHSSVHSVSWIKIFKVLNASSCHMYLLAETVSRGIPGVDAVLEICSLY